MGKKTKTKTGVGKARCRTRAYPQEFRLQIVRLYLEEGYTTLVLREQFGVSCHSVQRWAKRPTVGRELRGWCQSCLPVQSRRSPRPSRTGSWA